VVLIARSGRSDSDRRPPAGERSGPDIGSDQVQLPRHPTSIFRRRVPLGLTIRCWLAKMAISAWRSGICLAAGSNRIVSCCGVA
jgi:hypothetical protein